VPKVGQWGQLCVRVVRYNNFTIKSKLPKPQSIRIRFYKIIQVYNNEIYKDIQQIQDIQEIQRFHTLGPSMPQVALTPLGLPSLASNHEKHSRIR
jgi:hypothetical protein